MADLLKETMVLDEMTDTIKYRSQFGVEEQKASILWGGARKPAISSKKKGSTGE
ncbi:hypothetical protein KKI24_02825 [bacterium]|nr:hypothetical protein [bacterium]